jgi:O-glycosyl hydrolase
VILVAGQGLAGSDGNTGWSNTPVSIDGSRFTPSLAAQSATTFVGTP